MSKRQIDVLCLLAAGVVFAMVAVMVQPGPTVKNVVAADHRDSPQATGNAGTDINDIYAFRPTGTDDLCVVMTVNPFVGQPAYNLFDNGGKYEMYVDNNGDLTPDATISVRFSGNNPQMFSVSGLTGNPITGPVTRFSDASPVITAPAGSGIQIFAGPRDDPFFFDLVGFLAFTNGAVLNDVNNPAYTPDVGLRDNNELNGGTGNGAPADTFAGGNVGAIVIQFPIVAISGTGSANSGTIKAWAKTFKSQ